MRSIIPSLREWEKLYQAQFNAIYVQVTLLFGFRPELTPKKICIVNHDKNAKNLAVDKNESFAGVIILRGQVYNASCKMKQFN
ncbi:Uncharacterised protein [Salmonella enterica subsp. salamae]|nr:Uncharacterised protein [Salmonella enterica subsp. salamae]